MNQYGAANFDQGASRMTVEVVLTDTGGASASVTALVLVDVLNINEPPSITASSISIPESVAVGAPLGAPIAVTDPDDVQVNRL